MSRIDVKAASQLLQWNFAQHLCAPSVRFSLVDTRRLSTEKKAVQLHFKSSLLSKMGDLAFLHFIMYSYLVAAFLSLRSIIFVYDLICFICGLSGREVKLFTANTENMEKASFDVTEYYNKVDYFLLYTVDKFDSLLPG